MSFLGKLRERLSPSSLFGSDSRSEVSEPSGRVSPADGPPYGRKKKISTTSRGSKEIVEPVENWPIEQALKPVNNPGEWYHAAPEILRGEGYVLGVDPRNGRPKRLLGEQRTHSYVLGKSGTAKTTFLLTQALQDVEAGESVILVDPHADLARKFLSHIPKDRWEDMIYINPLSAKRWKKVVKLNFLEHVPELDKEVGKRAFLSAMKKIHPDAWGPRMQSIMKYALNLVYADKEFPKLKDLLEAIGNRGGERINMLESRRVDPETKRFWEEDYDDFRDFYKVAAQDKIYTLSAERDLEPMTDTRRTSVSFFEAMNEGKIIVIDIPEGQLSSNLTRYLGSLILTRIYQAATARGTIPESERKPVHLYVDEAHRFMSEVIQDNMRTLRKFGVFLTGASQSLQEYGETMGTEVQDLADTLIAFKCGEETAQQISASFSAMSRSSNKEPWEAIINLPYYKFYVKTPVGEVDEVRFAETVDLKWGPHSWKNVAKASLDEYGDSTREEKETIPLPEKFRPAEYLVLSALAEERKKKESPESVVDDGEVDWRLTKSDLYGLMKERYQIDTGKTRKAVATLLDKDLVDYEDKSLKSDGTKAKTSQRFFWVTLQGMHELYPSLHALREGSNDHVTMICQLQNHYRKRDLYPMPITEETGGITSGQVEYYPDLLVFPPYRKEEGYNARLWDSQGAFAVEVEAFPTGSRKEDVEEGRTEGTGSHLDRTVEHFRNARDRLEIPVVFAVRGEDDVRTVKDVLRENGATIRDGDPTRMGQGDVKVIQVETPLPDNRWLKKQVKESTKPAREKRGSGEEKSREEKPDESESGSPEAEESEGPRVKVETPSPDVPEEVKVVTHEKEEVEKREEKEDTGKGKETKAEPGEGWKSICRKLGHRVESRQAPEKLAEPLRSLKEKGCRFGLDEAEEARYLQVRMYKDNNRLTKNVCRVIDDLTKALKFAGIQVKGLTEPDRSVELPEADERLQEMDWQELIQEFKDRRKEKEPPEELAKVLFEMKESGCRFLSMKSGKRRYLYAYPKRKSRSNRKSCGPIAEDVEDALDMAQIEL